MAKAGERGGSGKLERDEPQVAIALSFAGPAIIQFGIFCCAVTMVIVLAVALAAG